jgi:hypothetical protein
MVYFMGIVLLYHDTARVFYCHSKPTSIKFRVGACVTWAPCASHVQYSLLVLALTAITDASAQVAKLFSAARDAVKEKKLRDVTLFRVPGSHIGFEDKLSLEPSPLTNNFITKPIFAIINFLVYKVRLLNKRIKTSQPPNHVWLVSSRSMILPS